MNTLKRTYLDHPAISATVTVVVLMTTLHLLRQLPIGYELSYVVSEVIVGIIMIAIIYLINGETELLTSTKGIGYAFKLSWWPLVIAIAGALFLLFGFAAEGHSIVGNPFIIVLGAVILAIFVGYFEEGLFRGVVLSAFLDKMGGSFKGILLSCIYSSIIFGFIHVYADFLGFFTNPSTFSIGALIDVIAKTLSAGLFGFILAVVFLRTHNLLAIAIVHAINDFVIFVPPFLYDQHILNHYVNTSATNASTTPIAYLIELIFELPALIYAYKQLKKVSIPQWGMFKEPYYPHNVKKGN